MLPRNRPPTDPGEMLLEEFLKPPRMTQTELAKRIRVLFPRINEIVNGTAVVALWMPLSTMATGREATLSAFFPLLRYPRGYRPARSGFRQPR